MGLTNIIPVVLLVGLFGCQVIINTNGQFASKSWPRYSLENMPKTKFTCRDKILGGYYADAEAQCQMFHICVKVAGVGVQDFRFLCPNGTAFDQEAQICADWGDIDCEAATLYYGSDNFDLYRIGSGFESKRAPYAEEEEEATFHLQRAETGDSRRSKQYIVNQNNRPVETPAFTKKPIEYQKPQPANPTTRQEQPPTTTPSVNNFASNKNDYYNNNNNNNKNDFYNSQKSKNDYNNKDDEIFKGSHSSHFYNNKDNGKEDFNEELNRKTSTTPKPQQQQQYQPIRTRQRGRVNYRNNNANNLPAVTKSTYAPTTTNLTPVNSYNNKQTLVPNGFEKQQKQYNDKFNNFNQKPVTQTTTAYTTSTTTPAPVQYQTTSNPQYFTPTTLAPVPFQKFQSNRDSFKIFVPQQTTEADYQQPQQQFQTTQQNFNYQTTTLPPTTQKVHFPQSQPLSQNRNQFYNANYENKATENTNNFFNQATTDFQKVAQPRNYNTDNSRANQFENFNRKNQNYQTTTPVAPSTYNPHYNLKLTPQNSLNNFNQAQVSNKHNTSPIPAQNNFNQATNNYNTSPAQIKSTTPVAPFFQERKTSNFFSTQSVQQQNQHAQHQRRPQQQPQQQQQNNFVTIPTTQLPTTTAAYTQFPPQPLISRQSSRFDQQNYRQQQQQGEVQNSSPRGFSTNTFFETTRTPAVTPSTTTVAPSTTVAYNDNRYQTISRNNNNNNNNNYNNNFNNNNNNNNNFNSNDNYTPSTIKKFSTLVPKELYQPTTFKPGTFNIKKASDPFLVANQQKFDKTFYNVQQTTAIPTTTRQPQTTFAPTFPPQPQPQQQRIIPTTTTTVAPTQPGDEDDGQYRPELYEKDFYRNKQKAKLNNIRNQGRGQSRTQIFYQSTQAPATTVNSGEDEFLKTAHSQNIAASGNELRARQNAAKINDLLSETKGRVKGNSSPRPFSNAPTIPPNATTTKKAPTKNDDKDASYDYAYYDTGASKDYSEYDVIEEFGKTNKKSKN